MKYYENGIQYITKQRSYLFTEKGDNNELRNQRAKPSNMQTMRRKGIREVQNLQNLSVSE